MVAGLAALTSGCQRPAPYATIQIEGRNYAFGMPRTAAPGLTAFRFVNAGTVRHEFQLFRFTKGISADSASRLLAADNVSDSAAEMQGGVLVAGPGETVRQQLLDSLKAGDVYGIACEFRDSAGAPKHSRLGMFAVMRVE
ncbi:MAG: hypothetical protein ABJD11_13830 [Gemmatimonadota bacterium]